MPPPQGLPNVPIARREYATFRDAVERMDRMIGRVLATLQETDSAEETIIIVTSDHGIDFPRYKCTLSPGGLGIQLIVHLPGQQAGQTVDGVVSNVDIAPTIVELAGGETAKATTEWGARSFVPALRDPNTTETRRYAFSEINYHVAYDPARSVFDGRYHYVEYSEKPEAVLPNIGDSAVKDLLFPKGVSDSAISKMLIPPRRGLYDLWFDPLQNNNLLDTPENRSQKIRLTDALNAWMEGTGDPLRGVTVSPPPGASVAPRGVYSSTAADPK